MSVREEDRQRNCPSRGLGIAAAAIGVGVGAALYYFFNKRNEQPDVSGSTSNWSCEEAQALNDSFTEDTNTSFHSNSTTSMTTYPDTSTNTSPNTSRNTSSDTGTNTSSNTNTNTSSNSLESTYFVTSNSSEVDNEFDTEDSYEMGAILERTDMSDDMLINQTASYDTISVNTTSDTSIFSVTSEREMLELSISDEDQMQVQLSISVEDPMEYDTEWEAITSVLHVPTSPAPPLPSFTNHLRSLITSSTPRSERQIRQHRDRSWALEECSICFEGMQRDQEVMALPCTHRFHQPCILPWLQERQTCPNCRKDA